MSVMPHVLDQRVTAPADPQGERPTDGDEVDEGTDAAMTREAGDPTEQGIFPGVPFS